MLSFFGIIAVACCLACIGYAGARLLLFRYESYEQLALRTIHEELDQVYIFMDPAKFFHLSMLLSVCMFLLGFLIAGAANVLALFIGLIFAAAGFFAPRLWVRSKIQQRLQVIEEQLPEALDMLSSSLRAGLNLEQAINRAGGRLHNPIAQEFGVICHECRLGSGIAEAINHWSIRMGLMDLKIIAAATEVAVSLGGNLAETYDSLSQLIRDRLVFEKEIGALTAEGRMQGVVMAALPFVILVLMTIINQEMMLPFLFSNVGILAVSLVAIMQVSAYFWIKKITDVEY